MIKIEYPWVQRHRPGGKDHDQSTHGKGGKGGAGGGLSAKDQAVI